MTSAPIAAAGEIDADGKLPPRRAGGFPKTIWLLATSKALNDSFLSIPTALMPLFVVHFSLSLSAVGLLLTTLSISSMLCQPVFGFLADRSSSRWFATVGPLVTIAGMGLMGTADSYGQLLLLAVVGGLGTAAFNPQAAALVGAATVERRGMSLAILATGGQTGRAIGPVLMTAIAARFGTSAVPYAILPALAIAGLCGASVRGQAGGRRRARVVEGISRAGVPVLVALCGLAVARAATVTAFSGYLPLHLTREGFALEQVGLTLGLLQLAGAAGSLIGGAQSDRIGDRAMLLFGILAPVPCLLLATFVDGWLSIVLLVLGTAAVFSSAAANTSRAMAVWPGGAAVVSGLIIGVAFGIGGAMAGMLGVFAESQGITATLQLAALLPLMGLPLLILIREPRSAKHAEPPARHAEPFK